MVNAFLKSCTVYYFSTCLQVKQKKLETNLKVKTLLLTLCIIGHLYGHHLKVLLVLSVGLNDVPRWKKNYVGPNLLTCVDSEF